MATVIGPRELHPSTVIGPRELHPSVDAPVAAGLATVGPPFAALDDVTKSLVSSAWNVVPDAIAAMCSYEAERRALAEFRRPVLHSELYDKVKPLLRFSKDTEDRLTGIPA